MTLVGSSSEQTLADSKRYDWLARNVGAFIIIYVPLVVCSSGLTATVMLPTPDGPLDDSEEDPEDEPIDEEDTDFLQDFPDDTEASFSPTSHSKQ